MAFAARHLPVGRVLSRGSRELVRPAPKQLETGRGAAFVLIKAVNLYAADILGFGEFEPEIGVDSYDASRLVLPAQHGVPIRLDGKADLAKGRIGVQGDE